MIDPGSGGYHRSHSHQRFQDFPSFQSSHRGTGTTNVPVSSAQRAPPYSSTSLGHNFRSRSLDHRRFPAFSSAGDRAIYTASFGGDQRISGAGRGQRYTGELFGGIRTGGPERTNPIASRLDSGSTHYRSSSTEKSGITVVPIRRESTLPPRRFQSEWKSEWKSGIGEEFGTGGGSLMQQQIDRMQQQEEEGKEEVLFDRSHKFSHNRQAWVKPQTHQNFYDRWSSQRMIEGPKASFPADSTTADYSTFRRSHQAGGGEAAGQHQQNQQHTRTQQYQKEVREWHSGDRHRRAAATAGATAADYGTLGTRRSATERYARGVGTTGGAVYQNQQQQQYYREGGYGGGGGGQRYQNYRQEHYANGWGGGGAGYQQNHYHQQHMKRSASAGGGGFFGTGRKSKSSKSSGARWSANRATADQQSGSYGPKRYRKVRLCCFNLIWPPWAVEPSGPPRPLYGRSKASVPPTQIPLEHRPFYSGPPVEGQVPPVEATAQQPQPGRPMHPQEANITGGPTPYPRGPPGVPEPPEYRAPPGGYEYQRGGAPYEQDFRGGAAPAQGPEYRGPPVEQPPQSLQSPYQRDVPVNVPVGSQVQQQQHGQPQPAEAGGRWTRRD